MKQKLTILFFFLPIPFLLHANGDKNTVGAKLLSAVVYRNGAELTHSAHAQLKQGNNDLVIEDISNNIDISSIRVHCETGVTVMSVEFSREFLKPEIKSQAFQRLEDSLEILNHELSRLELVVATDKDLVELLKANREIRGTQTGLSVSELVKLMDYYKQKNLELKNELDNAYQKQVKIQTAIVKIKDQMEVEEKKNVKTSGRLFLQLLSATPGTFDFTVSYLTPTAYWNPAYDLKAENITSPMKLVYKAKMVQTSGIDWKQVKLTLSTAVPSQNNNAPVLTTWFAKYADPVAYYEKSLQMNSIPGMLSGKVAGVQLNEVVVTGYTTSRFKSETEFDKPIFYVVNGKPVSEEEFSKIDQRAIKKTEKMNAARATSIYGSAASSGAVVVTLKDELDDYVSVNDNQVNVTFDIDLPYDVPSNGKEQNLVLKQYDVPSVFKYYSVPKMDASSFLLGEVAGWEKLNLLPGEASIMLEGTYVGKTYLDPNSTSDTMNITLGQDKRVAIKREKVKDYSSVKFLGANKKQIFTYEISVKNNKKEKAQMIVKDQYPVSSNKEIETELLESNGATVNNETGVLTWKTELAPGESKKFRISYSIKYPKEKSVNVN